MKHTAVKVLHYAKTSDNSWSTSSTEIVNIIDSQTDVNIQVKSDAFQMQLNLEPSINSSSFGFDDKILLFAKQYSASDDLVEIDTNNTTVFDSTFVFSGIINQWERNVAEDGSIQLTLQGVNVSERLLKTVLPATYLKTGSINTVPLIIQNLLGLVADKAAGKTITWDTGNPSLKSTGAAFPAIDYAFLDKTVYQMISDLSQDKYTGDGAYYYYIKSESSGEKFVWRKRTQDYVAGNILREGTDFKLGKVQYGIWDSVNYLIIYCGSDPRGNGIKTYAMDTLSVGSLGMRPKIITLSIAEAVHKVEQGGHPTGFSTTTRFPLSYPYTTTYDGTSIANDTEYVSWFRGVVRPLAKSEGLKIIQKYKYARYKVTANCFEGRNSLVLGTVYALHAPSTNWDENLSTMQKLRLIDVQHTIGGDGWNTKLDFEQDWEAVIQ
jgi:hypothetical protein